ncbi:obscurin-like [Halichondria panicea]|uniref:obscurin-like n=1 Tax=Halichondria panicea TaxID=6063 RepID=UPI00312B3632
MSVSGEAPVIGTQPENVDVERGGNAMLSVVATGEGLSYQWFGPDGEIEGATASTLRITNAGPDDAGDYRVRITTVNGGIVDSDTVSLSVGPAIDVQPSDVNAEAGGTATLTVEASGEGLSYQWFGPGGNALTDVDGDIEGSNSSTLQIINVESGDAGDYTVVVTNSAGSVVSDAATLSIAQPTQGPTLAPLILNCSTEFLAESQQVSVSCTSSRDLDGLDFECSFNDSSVTEGCGQFPFFVSVAGASGSQTIVISATDPADGAGFTSTITITTTAPEIETQPESVGVEQGGSASFTVEASGAGLTYQWFGPGGVALTDSDGEIEGSTSGTLTVFNAEPGDAGDYTVVVTNSAGSVTSDAATLSIGEAPVIGTQPENVDVERGGNATLSVVATGEGLSYQWFGPDGEIEGATASTLRITNAGPDDAGDYRVRITTVNGGIVDSDTVSLSVGPAIDVQPSDVNAEAGGTATLTVEASGEGLSYQWFGPGGNALTDVDGDIEGSNSSTLQIINAESGDAGDYTVVVTNSAGSVVSDAATLSIAQPTQGPTLAPLILNCSAEFLAESRQVSVSCTSSRDLDGLDFECSFNDSSVTEGCGQFPFFVSVAGASGSQTIVISATDPADGAGFTSTITITTTAPEIETQPESVGVEQGGSASFTVEASGAGLTYQWFGPGGVALTDSDGEIEGSTSGTLTVFNAEPGDAGDYTVVVTNSAGSVTSDAATLSIGEAPVIGTQPENVDVERGGNATLSVVATGEGLSYQWFGPDGEIEGATASTLRITNAGPDDAGDYRVRITTVNGGIVDSDTVSLSVGPAIDVQPSDVNAEAGGTATLTVEASGEGLSYQWFGPGGNALTDVDGDIEGSNSSTLQIINAKSGDAGDYTVVVTNSAGSVVSDAATLSIAQPTQGPTLAPLILNCSAEFLAESQQVSVSCTSSRDLDGLDFECSFNDSSVTEGCGQFPFFVSVAGASGSQTIVISATDPADGAGFTSTITITTTAPEIETQPESVGVEQGGSASFTVEASGAGLTYQWFGPGGVALTDSDGEIEGSTSGTLTVFNAEPGDAGDYTVVVTNSAGSVTSDAASLSIGPAIDVQPSDVNAAEAGGTATFTVEASGEGLLSYQWFGPGGDALTDVDGDIEGSNSSTLQIINVESGDAGDYTVVVTNSAGSVISDAATLSIGEIN